MSLSEHFDCFTFLNFDFLSCRSSQYQKLKVDVERQKDSLNSLILKIAQLKSRDESKLLKSQVEATIKRIMMNKKLSPNSLDTEINKDPPRSAPSVIPQRPLEKKRVRYSSEPAIVFHSGSGDSNNLSVKDFDSSSMFETKFSNCSNFLSDITCSKSPSLKSSILKVDTRNIGTNYSNFDFGLLIYWSIFSKELTRKVSYRRVIRGEQSDCDT